MARKNISIVVPLYNEEAGIEVFEAILEKELDSLRLDFDIEVIYVDDGSTDDTLKKLETMLSKKNAYRVVTLSRNFGKELAVTAGITEASGDAVIIMDGDGQHPPLYINQFLKEWEAGNQIVIGIRSNNVSDHRLLKSISSKLFYTLFNLISGQNAIPGTTDYRLITKEVRENLLVFTERNRVTRGLIDWLGYQRAYVKFEAPGRIAGEATYGPSQLIRLALNSFVSLSLKPLFIFAWLGLFITTGSLLLGGFILVQNLILGDPMNLNITGTAMLGVFTMFLIGIVLLSQGMIAAYLSHIHIQTQARPLFVVNRKRSINLKNQPKQ